MATKTLNTRIQLKYDTLANWQSEAAADKGALLVLKKGELGIVEIPTASPTAEQVTPPAILFKVGDGVKKFKELPWTSALAADVYAWAKKANPDVADFSAIIAEARNGLISADSVVKTLEGLKGDVKVTAAGRVKKTVDTDANTINISTDFTDAENNVLASGITAAKVEAYDGYDARITEAKKAGTDASAALTAYETSNDAKVNKNTSDISGLKETLKSGITFKGKVTDFPANPENGWLVIKGTKEYIYEGTSKEWIELGDEGSHLTKATADTYYVPLERTIAGKALSANISAADMRTALNVADGATKVVESTVSGWGFTKNKGTVTGITMDGAALTVSAAGVVDLGTVIHAHQDISGKQDKAISLTGITAKTVEGALTEIKGIADSKQTAAQVTTAISTELAKHAGIDKVGTVTSVSAGVGLKVTGTASVSPKVEIDEGTTFIFDCGSSTVNV